MAEKMINYVIQLGSGNRWTNVSLESDERLAASQYDSWAKSTAVREGRTSIRMIKRVAIVTDQVIKEGS